MGDPLTTEDLYGVAPKEGEHSNAPAQPTTPPAPPLQYEETPVIQPIAEQPPNELVSPSGGNVAPRRSSCLGTLGTIILFAALFVVGIWLSSFIRQFFPSDTGETTVKSTPSPTGTSAVVNPNDPYATWKAYEVISGVTKLPVAGVSFKLPADVLSPICDGTGCASQGTYLPGGTRFTVAARGTGQSLQDFRGSLISDVGGVTFTTKPISLAGLPATEFTGVFTGRTISGYAFSRMRGVMVELSSDLSLEINHFTPNGITADFEKDDTLFDTILKTFTFSGASNLLPSPTSSITPFVNATKAASTSGY